MAKLFWAVALFWWPSPMSSEGETAESRLFPCKTFCSPIFRSIAPKWTDREILPIYMTAMSRVRDCHLAFTFVFVMQNKKTRKSSLTAVERGFRLCVDTASTPSPTYNELLLTSSNYICQKSARTIEPPLRSTVQNILAAKGSWPSKIKVDLICINGPRHSIIGLPKRSDLSIVWSFYCTFIVAELFFNFH